MDSASPENIKGVKQDGMNTATEANSKLNAIADLLWDTVKI